MRAINAVNSSRASWSSAAHRTCEGATGGVVSTALSARGSIDAARLRVLVLERVGEVLCVLREIRAVELGELG